jgi:acetyl-CoA C-acetyltransferase
MTIQAGDAEIVAVQGLSKSSNMLTHDELLTFAIDPLYGRQLRESPMFVAGLEMSRFLHETGTTRQQCAEVVVRNRRNALRNPRAGHGCVLELEQVLASEPVCEPLCRLDISPKSDGAVVAVLASEEAVRSLDASPVWVRGIGWCTETPNLESHAWGAAPYMRSAAQMAYRMAGIRSPRSQIDFFEVNDAFSYKQLVHLVALDVFLPNEVGPAAAAGVTEPGGELPVNVSGGSLGMGATMELDGGQRLLEVVLQLRGQAGESQLRDVSTGLAASWRGVPTTTGAVAVLSN